MPDERVQAAIQHWAGRFIANGIEYNDFVRTTASISRLGRVARRLDSHRRGPQGSRRRGARPGPKPDRRRGLHAGGGFAITSRSSSGCSTASSTGATPGGRSRDVRRARVSRSRRRSGSRRRWTAASVAANLRRPVGDGPAAARHPDPGPRLDQGGVLPLGVGCTCAAGWPRCRSTGPVRARPASRCRIRPDYEVAVAAILDALDGRPGTRSEPSGRGRGEPRRLLRGAHGRLRAADQGGGRGQRSVSASPPGWRVNADPDAARRSCTTAARRPRPRRAGPRRGDGPEWRGGPVEQPCLVVTGKLDRVVPWEETKRIADDAPRRRVGPIRGWHSCLQQHPVQVPTPGRRLDARAPRCLGLARRSFLRVVVELGVQV